jgi:hypothetical protein
VYTPVPQKVKEHMSKVLEAAPLSILKKRRKEKLR